jgi:hypothetical protein
LWLIFKTENPRMPHMVLFSVAKAQVIPANTGLSTYAVQSDARGLKKLHPPTTPCGFQNIFNHNALCLFNGTRHGIVQFHTCFLKNGSLGVHQACPDYRYSTGVQ